jgi:hypothetical protein
VGCWARVAFMIFFSLPPLGALTEAQRAAQTQVFVFVFVFCFLFFSTVKSKGKKQNNQKQRYKK